MAVEESVEYDFAPGSEPWSDYICPVKHKIMLEPYQTECCGNHLSSNLAERLMREKKPCPLCSAPSPSASGSMGSNKRIFAARKDLFFQKKIFELQVYCPHSKNGCKWVGPLKDAQSHTLSCNMQPWKCQYCGIKGTLLFGTTEHDPICRERPIQCTCGIDPIPFCEFDDHLKMCPAQLVPCEFGCQSKVSRKNMPQHMEECMSRHQLLVAQQTLKMVTELSAKFSDGATGASGVMEEVAGGSHEADRLQDIVEMREEEVTVLKEQLKEKEDAIVKLEGMVKQVESDKEELTGSIGCVVAKHQTLVEQKETEIRKLLLKRHEVSEDSKRHIRRLQSQIEQKDDDIQELQGRTGSVAIGRTTVESLQEIVQGLRSKKGSMSGKDVSVLASQLEEVLTQAVETASLASSDGYASDGGGNPMFCRGKLERVVIDNLKKPWGLAVKEGKLYAVDNGGSHGLHVSSIHDQDGSVEMMIASASISETAMPPGKCWYPRGVALDKDSNIILGDTGTHRVLKFSPRGKLLASAGTESMPGNTSGEFNSPSGIAIGPEGKIFVCDRFNHRIQVLGPKLQFMEEFGESGSDPEQFTHPWDVAFDADGNVYVADCGNRCVKVFTSDLKLARVIGKGEGKYKKGDLRAPTSLCVDKKDFLYVTDIGFRRVMVYDTAGNFKCNFGKFTDPRGIAVDEEGRVYVSDSGGGSFILHASGRVQMFS